MKYNVVSTIMLCVNNTQTPPHKKQQHTNNSNSLAEKTESLLGADGQIWFILLANF